jgi:uncharacterized lipoprotein YddW (UPF0748 family)
VQSYSDRFGSGLEQIQFGSAQLVSIVLIGLIQSMIMWRFRHQYPWLKFSRQMIWRLLALCTCTIVLLSHQVPYSLAQQTVKPSLSRSAKSKPPKKVATRPKLFPKSQLPPPMIGVPESEILPPIPPDTVLPTDEKPSPKDKKPDPIPVNPYPPLPRQEIRGVWLTNNDMTTLKERSKLSQAMAQLGQLNFNTVYPVVWNSGYVTYHSQVAQQAGIQPFFYKGTEGQDILADVAAQAHRQGLTVVPWFEFGFMAPASSELAMQHPEWLTQTRNGEQTSVSDAGEVSWLNPFHPEVQKFITDLVVEIVSQYDVDGIQFDDHMSLPHQFGYDPYTLALYTQETKKQAPRNPEDAEWTRWRANKITEFMFKLRIAVKERKPRAIVSVSPNYADFAYKFHLQDWRTWINRGMVDELIVQVYGPDMNRFVNKITRPEMVEANQKISTAVGIMTGQRRKPVSMRQIQSQVQESHDRGLGVVFFYYESLWNDAPEPVRDRQLGFQYMFRSPARRV